MHVLSKGEAGFNEELPFKGKDFITENVCFENSALEMFFSFFSYLNLYKTYC
ncbi:hypothetical protein HanXRQr2_Chr15g0718511 [Helianthus annuus]|uniref:Uncharacterized protein n=1 Tax=Helianthus annuus TaxID=4232 RepID=A0A9K3E5E4_HELAN|nr:hypothetical protein HanXRQr2_Chr15g0718511 [Helianthus annuus]KAJ0833343.1 hypothetical protein HanPSC8_Chr15g0689291 [Helianthus annuus]